MKSNRSNGVHFRSNFRSLEDFFARDFFSVCAAYMVSADRGAISMRDAWCGSMAYRPIIC